MQAYKVLWEIDIEAESPKVAAEKARYYQTVPSTTATVFDVLGEAGEVTRIDLMEHEETDGDEGKV
jgi:hypothetical protein